MSIRERMYELIEDGAALQVPGGEAMQTFILAGVLWRSRPTRLRWCGIFPEHQGHIHETPYDKVKLINEGRDIAFYQDTALVLYVTPYAESGLELDPALDALAEWQQGLAQHNNTAQFSAFLETA